MPLDQIVAIHGAEDYRAIKIATGQRFLHRTSLQLLGSELPQPFVRAHRSHIVNLNFAAGLERSDPGIGQGPEAVEPFQDDVGEAAAPIRTASRAPGIWGWRNTPCFSEPNRVAAASGSVANCGAGTWLVRRPAHACGEMTVLQFPARFTALVLDRFLARDRPIAEIERDRQAVRAIVCEDLHDIEAPFPRIRVSDLISLFDVYDGIFFDGSIRTALAGRPLTVRFSRRATRRGGSLHRFRRRIPEPGAPAEWFEMTVSTSLLFDTFGANDRPVSIGGHECVDRLDALQRIVEHEIVHLLEYLRWDTSGCAGARFRWLARAVFGHTEAQHRLVTPRERAAEQGWVPGRRVAFEFEGTRYEGIVGRVTKRATVLVPHPSGEPMNDGGCYLRFYVPLTQLTPVSDDAIASTNQQEAPPDHA